MNISQDILLVLLISIITSATGTDLATNSNILLILLLALTANNQGGCTNQCACNGQRLFF